MSPYDAYDENKPCVFECQHGSMLFDMVVPCRLQLRFQQEQDVMVWIAKKGG